MKPIRIVFLLQDLCIGGTQHQTLALAAGLDRTRFSPALWTFSGPTRLDALAGKHNLPVLHLGTTVFPGPAAPAALWKQIGRERPDILFLCTALPNIWGRVIGRMRGLPRIVGSCRGGGAPRRQHERFLRRFAQHIVCNSPALIEVMAGLGQERERMSFIANGVDTGRFAPGPLPLERREPVILCVARLAEDKNLHCLLDAFALLLGRMPEARLRLVGDGPLESGLRARMERELPAGRAELLPADSDIPACCRKARAFALSSRREGMPNVILEAMAAGLPVAATRVGGIPFLLEAAEGLPQSGLLVPEGDAPALAEALLRLLDDSESSRRMGEAGRARVERDFSFSAMITAHEKLFARLMETYHG